MTSGLKKPRQQILRYNTIIVDREYVIKTSLNCMLHTPVGPSGPP